METDVAESRGREWLRAGFAGWLTLVAAAAVVGFADLAQNAQGFSVAESIQTDLLWIALGALAGLPAWIGVRRKIVVAIVWFELQSGVVHLVQGGWMVPPVAVAATAGLIFFARRRMQRDEVLPSVLVLIACLSGSAILGLRREDPVVPAQRAAGERPNVVLVVLDTFRADHVGAYGDTRGLTPCLDALAQRSTLYEQAYATAPWTIPSHASLFTGLYPTSHGATCLRHRWLDDRFTTLAESLKKVGYDTAAFSANRYLAEGNLAQGFDRYRALGDRFDALRIRPVVEALGWPAKWADHGAAEGVEAVEEYLDARAGSSAPLFLFTNLMEPHWRYLPPLSDRGALLPDDVGTLEATGIALQVYGPLMMAGKRVGGPVEVVVRALYAAAVRYQDRQLARLLAAVDARLDPARTILVVTADHGENLGEAGRWDHVFAIDDRLIHVPLLVRYPPAFPAGTRVAGMCQLVDVPTTIASLVTGAELASDVAGRTLVPSSFQPRPFVIAEGDPYFGHLERMAAFTGFRKDVGRYAEPLLSIRAGAKKLVVRGRRAPELFDVSKDPDETRDVLANDPATAEALLQSLVDALGALPPYRMEAGADAAPPSPLLRDALDRLRRTGYAGKDE